MRIRLFVSVVTMFVALGAFAQTAPVSYSDDFQSYGSPRNPAGWVDTSIGASTPVANGLYKTWPDPLQGNKATNIVYGTKQSSGHPQGNNPRIGTFSTYTAKNFFGKGRFEYRGRFLKQNSDTRIGFTFFSSYPESDSYYLIGLWARPSTQTLTMQLFRKDGGALTGLTDSGFTPAVDKWHQFLIQVDDVDGATKVRARFWLDGSAEPATWSIEASDSSAQRLIAGRIGIWSAVKGDAYIDDLSVKSPVDHTAPVLTFRERTLVLPYDSTTRLDHVAHVDISAADDLSGIDKITATQNGEPYRSGDPLTAEGPHPIVATAVDRVGNSSTAKVTVLVDTSKPVVTITETGQPLTVTKFNRPAVINFAATDAWTGVVSLTATLDGASYVANTPISTPGTHYLIVTATDGVGNRSVVPVTLLVDVAAPVIAISESGTAIADAERTFSFNPKLVVTVTDSHSTASVTTTIDAAPFVSGSVYTVSGWHTLKVVAVDEAGNRSERTLRFLVDRDAPTVQFLESTQLLDVTKVAAYDHNVGIDIKVTDATSEVKWTATLDGAAYVPLAEISTEQTHILRVVATDAAMNRTEVSLSVLVDKGRPVITFRENGALLDAAQLQKFTRDAAIEIVATDSVSTATYTATLDTQPYASKTPITNEGEHELVVNARDTAGNTATATLRVLVDKTKPQVAFYVADARLDETKVTPFQSVGVELRVTDNLPGVTYTATLDGADYTSNAPIAGDGVHRIIVVANDRAGNVQTSQVDVLVDKTGPFVEFLEGTKKLVTTAREDFNHLPAITVRIDDAHSTVTSTIRLDNDQPFTSGSTVAAGRHTITVHAVDALGNATDAKLDLLADAAPPVVTLQEGSTVLPASGAIFNRDVTITARVVDDSNTVTTATLNGDPFALSGAIAAERNPHTLVVTTVDELKWSTTVTSTFIVDKSAPVITIRANGEDLLAGKSFAKDVTLTAVSDDITNVVLSATLKRPDGTTAAYTFGTPLTANGKYTLTVSGEDQAHNVSAPSTIDFFIDKNAPEVTLKESNLPWIAGKTYDRAVVVTADITAATQTTQVVTIDNQPYVLGGSWTREGKDQEITVVVTNSAGLSSTVKAQFSIDMTPPSVELYAGTTRWTAGQKFASDVTVTTRSNDNQTVKSTVITLDGHTVSEGAVISEEKVHEISATATDAAGRTATDGPYRFVIDKTAPKVTVVVGTEPPGSTEPLLTGAKFRTKITPKIVVADDTAYTIEATIDNVAWVNETEVATDGVHTLLVKVTDDLAHVTTLDPIVFTIDTKAPVVTIVENDQPFTGGKFKRSVTPVIRVEDTTTYTITATLDTNQWSTGQEVTSEGRHVLAVLVTDAMGWSTVVNPEIVFTIDRSKPVITVTESGLPLVTNAVLNHDAQLKIVVADTTTPAVTIKLNGQTIGAETVVDREEVHTLTIHAVDELGFEETAGPIVFTVDKTAPVLTLVENGSPLVSGALLDHYAVPHVVVNDKTPVTLTARLDDDDYTLDTPITSQGSHTLRVSGTDAAGWTTTLPPVQFVIDTLAPVVTLTERDVPFVSGAEYGRDVKPKINVSDISTYTIVAKLDADPFTSETEVTAEGEHVLRVTVTDQAGHVTVVPPVTFIVDKSAPVVTVTVSNVPFTSGMKFRDDVLPVITVADDTKTTIVATLDDAPYIPGTPITNERNHSLAITVTDNLGHTTIVPPITFTLDKSAPVVVITEGGRPLVSNTAFKVGVKPEITVTDTSSTTIEASLNGEPFIFGTELTAEGKYTLAVTVTDELGWKNRVAPIVFFIDRTPPVVSIIENGKALEDGTVFNRDVTPKAVITDTTETTATATLNGNAFTLETAVSAEGTHALVVTVTDAVGLATTLPAIHFTIDKTAPAVTIDTPLANSIVNTAQVTVAGRADDAVSVTINGDDAIIDSAAKTYAAAGVQLLEGANTIVAFAVDKAGNSASTTVDISLDTRAPELTVSTPAANACIDATEVELRGETRDASAVSVTITNGAVITNATLNGRSWSAIVPLPAEGKRSLRIDARDASGLLSTTTLPLLVDRSAPVVSITEAGAPFAATVLNRTVALTVRVADVDERAALVLTLDGQPYVSGTSITAEGTHTLRARATDCAGHASSEQVVTFTIDRTPPAFTALVPANGAAIGTRPAVSGTLSEAASVSIEGTTAATAFASAFSLGASLHEGENRLVLIATDRAGNSTRLPYAVTVHSIAPTVSIVENGSPIAANALFNRAVTPRIESNDGAAVISAQLNGSVYVSGTPITADGQYTLTATASDAFGHSSPAATATFTIDRTAPVVQLTAPADNASVSADHIEVRGTVTGADVRTLTVNGTLATAAADGTFSANVPLELGPNAIVAVAVDHAGNSGAAEITVQRDGGKLALLLTSPIDKTLTNRKTTVVAGQVLTPANASELTINGTPLAFDAAGAFRRIDFPLTEGENSITAVVRGANGTTNQVSISVTADFTPPQLFVRANGVELTQGARFTTSPVITLQATDNNATGLTTRLIVDGSTVIDAGTLSEGGHALTAIARDAAGNETRIDRTLFVGSVTANGGCTLSAFDPADGTSIFAGKVKLSGRSGGAAAVLVNGQRANLADGSFIAEVTLVEGRNDVVVRCANADGTPTSDAPVTVVLYRFVDPAITITSPANGAAINTNKVTVTGTVGAGVTSGDVNGVAFTIPNDGASSHNWTVENVPLTSGLNIVAARARTSSGRAAVATVRVLQQSATPSITITSPLPGTQTGAASVDVSGVYSNVDPATLAIGNGAWSGSVTARTLSNTSGTFTATAVALPAGAQSSIIVSGRSAAGAQASATVDVQQLASAPSISISTPADNTYYASTFTGPVQLTGTIDDGSRPIAGAQVSVNGNAATVTGSTFTAAVDLSTNASGVTPVVARVSMPDGRSATDSLRLVKLTGALSVKEIFPAANAVEVDPAALIVAVFSNALDASTVAANVQLLDVTNNVVAGQLYVDRDAVSFAPHLPLRAGERYTFAVNTGLKDAAGSALATAFSSGFTVATTAPATPPVVDLPELVAGCFTSYTITGHTTVPGARVRVLLDGVTMSATSTSTGAFSITVNFSGQSGYHVARLRQLGADGTLSAERTVSFRISCNVPQVLSSSLDRAAKKVTIQFSKPMDASTLIVGASGSIVLTPAGGSALDGTVALNAAGDAATVSFTTDVADKLVTLLVTKSVKDSGGLAMSNDYTQTFTLNGETPLEQGKGYVSGAVYDATTGRPLPGASVSIDGITITTDERGRYTRSLPEGAYTIEAKAAAATSVWRQIVVPVGAGVVPIDIRLTERGDAVTTDGTVKTLTNGAATAVTCKAELLLPSSVTPGRSVRLTSVGAQSLAGLLPLGWSPLAAAEIVVEESGPASVAAISAQNAFAAGRAAADNSTSVVQGGPTNAAGRTGPPETPRALSSSSPQPLAGAKLSFEIDSSAVTAAAQSLSLVQYDAVRDEWRVVAASLTPVNKLTVDIASSGQYALVYPDKAANLITPPAATTGAPLAGVVNPCTATPEVCRFKSRSFVLDPKEVLPNGRTVATLTVEAAVASAAKAAPSGTAVQAFIDEQLNLADGRVLVDPPFATDLLIYRNLAGDAGTAQFHLAPTKQAAAVLLRDGVDHIRVVDYPGRIDRGTLVGAEGGRVPGDGSVTLDVPVGATTEPVHASVAAMSAADLAAVGTIQGFRVAGGFTFTLTRTTEPAAVEGLAVYPLELVRPARATFSLGSLFADLNSPQVIVAELLGNTPYGTVTRLAAIALAANNTANNVFTTRDVNVAQLPVDGLVRGGRYVILVADQPIAYAFGIVRANELAVAGAKVTATSIGVTDVTRIGGTFALPVPAKPAAPLTLTPRSLGSGDGAARTAQASPDADTFVDFGTLVLTVQPPQLLSTTPVNGAVLNAGAPFAGSAQFNVALDPSSAARAITVNNLTTGKALPGSVTIAGSTVSFASSEPLAAGSRYAMTIAPSIRGNNSAPFARTVTVTFETRTVATNATVRRERIRITIPDANGKSIISGLAGALPAGAQALAVRRSRAFIVPYQATVNGDGSFSFAAGTDSTFDRISTTDLIDLQVLDSVSHAIVAIVPLTPFSSADARAFIAPAGVSSTFTTADDITITVPAGAFEVPTRIDVAPVTKAALAGVPDLDQELNVRASVRITFEGTAKKRLEVSIPLPANTPTDPTYFLGYLYGSVRGPRIELVDPLRISGGKFTTDFTSAVPALRSTNGLRAVSTGVVSNPADVRRALVGTVRTGVYSVIDFTTAVGWTTIGGITAGVDMFWQNYESLVVSTFALLEGRGRVLIPVSPSKPFRVVGVDASTGIEAFSKVYEAPAAGDPGSAVSLPSPIDEDTGAYPVFATPGRLEVFELGPEDTVLTAMRGFTVLPHDGNVTFTAVAGPARYELFNVTQHQHQAGELQVGQSLPSMQGDPGDLMVATIGVDNVDPDTPFAVAFNKSLYLGEGSSNDAINAYIQENDLVTVLSGESADALTEITDQVEFSADSGNRRIKIDFKGSLQRGRVYRVQLSPNLAAQTSEGPGLKLMQRLTGGTAGPLAAPLILDVKTRKPGGLLRSTDLGSGRVRDLSLNGNIAFVAALDGGLQAFDVSDPAKINEGPMATLEGVASENWAVATDHHGRVYTTAVGTQFGSVRSYRLEDFLPQTPGESIVVPQTKVKGGGILSWSVGYTSSLPLGATQILSDRPEAIPRKIQLLLQDDEQPYQLADLPYITGAPATISGGFSRVTMQVPFDASSPYHYQRVTLENRTLNVRWSADARPGSPAVLTGVLARENDSLYLIRNKTTYGVFALFGFGIGVFDLNAIESNDVEHTNLAEKITLTDARPCRASHIEEEVEIDCAGELIDEPCDPASGLCPLRDIAFTPEALLIADKYSSNVIAYALDANRGVLDIDITPPRANDQPPPAIIPGKAAPQSGLILASAINPPLPYHPRLQAMSAAFVEAHGLPRPRARFTAISPYNTKRDGVPTDYALVAAHQFGVLVLKLDGGLHDGSLVDQVWIPAGAASVRVMPGSDLAVVVDNAGRVMLLDLKRIDRYDTLPSIETCGNACGSDVVFPIALEAMIANGVPTPSYAGREEGVDDPRILWKSDPGLVKGTLPPLVDPTTGIVFTGDVNEQTIRTVAATDPRIRFMVDTGDPTGYRETGAIVPLGLEPPASVQLQGPNASLGVFRLELRLPGSIAESLPGGVLAMAVESERVTGSPSAQTLAPWPVAHLRETDHAGDADPRSTPFHLRRLLPYAADDPQLVRLRYQSGYNTFVSPWIVAIADPRASRDWTGLTPAEKKDLGCYSCERPTTLGTFGTDWFELYTAGRIIAVRPKTAGFASPYQYLAQADRLVTRVPTTMADTVRATSVVTPAQNVAVAGGVLQGTVVLHSGEVIESSVDLDAGGRAGWNVIADRTYRSRTLGGTALGLNWDSSLFQRLRLLPVGDVEYRDGSGEIWRFRAQGNDYTTPPGLDLVLRRSDSGWTLFDAKHRVTAFDQYGRLTSQADEFANTAADLGNVVRYLYGADGQLARIIDPVKRATDLTYHPNGLLRLVRDWRNRDIEYVYTSGRLTEARLVNVPLSTRRVRQYGYQGGSGLPGSLELGSNLTTIIDPGQTRPRVTFTYGSSDSKRDFVSTELWGTDDGARATFDYTFNGSSRAAETATVTDARGQERRYTFNAPQPKNYTDDRVHLHTVIESNVPEWSAAAFGALPALNVVQTTASGTTNVNRSFTFIYEPDGRLKSSVHEGVGETSYGYQPIGQNAGLGKVVSTRDVTGSGGTAGLAQVFNHDGAYLTGATSGGVSLPVAEPRRDLLAPQVTDGGVRTTSTYYPTGQLQRVASEAVGGQASGAGSDVSVEYYAADHAAEYNRARPRRIDNGGLVTTIDYIGGNSSIKEVQHAPRDVTTTTTYDADDRPTNVVVSGPGVATDETMVYQGDGRLHEVWRKRTVDGADVTDKVIYTYDLLGRVTEQVVRGAGEIELERTTTRYVVPEGKIVTTLPGGAVVTTQLDGAGRVADVVTNAQNKDNSVPPEHISTISTHTRYDRAGNVVFTSDELMASATRYDAAHRPVETIRSDGTSQTFETDGLGRITKLTDVQTGQAVESHFTPGGKLELLRSSTSTETFKWDGAGRTRSIVFDALRAPSTEALSNFDTAGRLLDTQFGLASGSAGSGSGNTLGSQLTQTRYHWGGLDVPATTDHTEHGDTYHWTLTHDALGRTTRSESNESSDLTHEATFDEAGNVTREKTPERRSPTTYTHDARGLQQTETVTKTAAPATTSTDFDASGALRQYTDPTGDPTITVNDGLGRPVVRTYPDQSTEKIWYEKNRIVRTKDRQDRTREFVYDPPSGRLIQIVGASGTDVLTYEPGTGRLQSWKSGSTLVEYLNYDVNGMPQLTRQTRYKADGTALDSLTQTHEYDGLGRRTKYSMPGSSLGAGWASSVSTDYDAFGNVRQITRDSDILMTAIFRSAGRPAERSLTLGSGSAFASDLIRRYDYDDAGRLQELKVESGDKVIAGSHVTFEGLKIATTRFLGTAADSHILTVAYDEAGRVTGLVPSANQPANGVSGSRTHDLNDADFMSAVNRTLANGAVAPPKTFAEGEAHKIASLNGVPFKYQKAGGSEGGSLRTEDDRFRYEFDEQQRLVRVTQKSTTGLVPVYMRATYSYTAMNRVVGRRVEVAPQSAGSNAPDASWRLATAQEMVSDSLPASTTFVWDPISDQLVAIFEAERYEGTGVVASGRLLRQFIHGGMGLDDPIEVTIGDGSTVRRVYPIYDEAATGALQAIVDDHGKLLQRTFMADAYGAEEATLTGPSADRVRLTTKKDNDGKVTEVQIDLRITEPVNAGTVEAGARLSTVTTSGTTAYVSTVVPTLPDPNTIRWTLNATQWTSLSAATNASALSMAATADLRSTTFGANVPLSPPAIAASGIITNGPNPFEYREPLTTFASATNGITTTTPYELATPGEAATPGHPTDSASSLIISSFQAQPFYDTFIGKNYVRERWYDPTSGTWLTPDPIGYGDSANMYAFGEGDPINHRDPTGEAYDPAAVHRWMQSKVAAAKVYYSSSDSVAVDAIGNTLADIGSGFSGVFNIGTKTGATYVDENGFQDGYSTTMILSAAAGDVGETILAATGIVSAGVKTVQTVTQVRSLVRIGRELKVAATAERQGELLTQRAMVRRGWELGSEVKIRGRAGAGNGNQGIDQVYERTNVISPNRTAAVEVKSANRPELRTDRLRIQQGSDAFNQTRLARAADPRVSNSRTIAAAHRYQAVRQAGKLESYKATYDASKRSVSLSRLISDSVSGGRTIVEEIKTWLLW